VICDHYEAIQNENTKTTALCESKIAVAYYLGTPQLFGGN